MPKISKPTVAEHRAAQRAALVNAGERLLIEGGLAGVSPRTVCERTGLSRSSFYDYFASKDDFLVAIAIDAMTAWNAEISAVLADTVPGLPELRTFIDKTMEMTAEGKHEIAGVLRDANLSPSRFEDVRALHDALMEPVARVLRDLGHPRSRSTEMLVQGVLGTGIQLVSHGMDPRRVADDVYRLLTQGVTHAQ